MQSIGKDFNALQKQVCTVGMLNLINSCLTLPTSPTNQIPSRTVKELVQYYYHWKKTEHYDAFLQTYGKMGKKKFSLPPGYLLVVMATVPTVVT